MPVDAMCSTGNARKKIMQNPSSKLCSLSVIGTSLLAITAPAAHASEFVLDFDIRQISSQFESEYIGVDHGNGIGGGSGGLPYGTPWVETTRSNIFSQDGHLQIDGYASQSSTIDTVSSSWTGTNTASSFVAARMPLAGVQISSSSQGESIFDMWFSVTETTQARLTGIEYSLYASEFGESNLYAGVVNLATGDLLYSFSEDIIFGETSGSFDSGLLDFEAGQFYGLYIYTGSTTSMDTVPGNPILESSSVSLTYDFSIVPAPSSTLALAIGGLVTTRRRRA